MEGADIYAVASVKLTKIDENGNIISIDEHEVDLTEKEVCALWDLHQQA